MRCSDDSDEGRGIKCVSKQNQRTCRLVEEAVAGLTPLKVAPEVDDLPDPEREERAEREEEEVAHPVVCRLCGSERENRVEGKSA